jgi:two-component system, LytTR family, sensor kinase
MICHPSFENGLFLRMNVTVTQSPNWFFRYKAHHVLMWIAYFAFFFVMYRQWYPSPFSLLIVISIYFVFNAAAFYTTAYVLLPKFLYTNRFLIFLLLFIGLILALAIGLTFSLYLMLRKYTPEVDDNLMGVFQVSLLSIVTMVGFMVGIKVYSDKVRSDRNNRVLEKQRLETELQYLKAQVNPHFLFNSINSVYFLIKKDPDQAAQTLIKLSDLLRFQLYDCSEDYIAIEKEIEYLENYISLERIRKGEKVQVTLRKEGRLSGFQIAPFMVIPFLENAFKHVSNSSKRENKIEIVFLGADDKFEIAITNTVDGETKSPVGGIGLKNVQRRLQLLYPNKHKLEILPSQTQYFVRLTLEHV